MLIFLDISWQNGHFETKWSKSRYFDIFRPKPGQNGHFNTKQVKTDIRGKTDIPDTGRGVGGSQIASESFETDSKPRYEVFER